MDKGNLNNEIGYYSTRCAEGTATMSQNVCNLQQKVKVKLNKRWGEIAGRDRTMAGHGHALQLDTQEIYFMRPGHCQKR